MSTNPHVPKSPRPTHSPRSPAIQLFEDPDIDEPQEPEYALADDDDDDDNGIPYPEPSLDQTLLPPPNFRSFFTIVEDATSGEHYHPYVHYVFADDDPVIVTAASMRSLGLDETMFLPQASPEDEHPDTETGLSEQASTADDAPVESPLPPPIPGTRETYLIIDLGADGRTVIDAQSLSPEWQVTNTSIRTAPSFDATSPDQGYMLRIEGLEVSGGKARGKEKGKEKGQAGSGRFKEARERAGGHVFAALDALVGGVEEGLAVAEKIVGGSEKGNALSEAAQVVEREEEDLAGDAAVLDG